MNEKTIDECILLVDTLLKEKKWNVLCNVLMPEKSSKDVYGYDDGAVNPFLHQYYIDTNKQRIFYLLETFGAHFWKGKTVVELGGCIGPASNVLTKLGAKCEVWEGRKDIVEKIQKVRKNIKYVVKNLEEPFSTKKKFDIVINWGVLYHISKTNYESFLINSANLAKQIMFLDTNVWPLNESELFMKELQEDASVAENSLVGQGTIATEQTIRTILEKTKLKTVERVTKKLDEQKFSSSYTYVYDNTSWESLSRSCYFDSNNNSIYRAACRAWFNCYKS